MKKIYLPTYPTTGNFFAVLPGRWLITLLTLGIFILGGLTTSETLAISAHNRLNYNDSKGIAVAKPARPSTNIKVLTEDSRTVAASFFTCPTILSFTSPSSGTITQCANTALTLTVTNNAVAPEVIRFVYFTSPQSGTAMYSGGTTIGTIAASSISGTKSSSRIVTVPANEGTATQTLYVYAIVDSGLANCFIFDSFVLNVRPAPATVIGGSTTVCQGSSTTLTLPPGSAYRWSTGATTRTITPLINAATNVYSATLTNANGCVSAPDTFTVTGEACTSCVSGPGRIGGVVYNDFNANGARSNTDPGLSDITVRVFACSPSGSSTLVATTTTDLAGNYQVSGLTDGVTYRVEFSNIPTQFGQSMYGAQSGTSVQFVRSPSCNVSLGLSDPRSYCQDDARVAVVCFARNTDLTSEPVIIDFTYADGDDFTARQATDSNRDWAIPLGTYPLVAKRTIGNVGGVGTTFGLTYDKTHRQLLTGSYMRAYAPMKTGSNGFGEGVIYRINYTTTTPAAPTTWLDLETVFGAGYAGTYATDNTFPSPTTFGITNSNPAKIGYTGLGSMRMADDDSELYVVNLRTQEVLVIPVDQTTGAAVSTQIKRFPIPTDACPTGTWSDGRPYRAALGLGVHPTTKRVYATLTCTGPTLTNVRGLVYSFDPKDTTPSSADFRLETTIPLNITIPATNPNDAFWYDQIVHTWDVVTPNTTFYENGFTTTSQHTHPWLGEVAFDQQPDGKYGMVVATRNRYHDIIHSSVYVAGGLLHRVANTGTDAAPTWQMEANAVAGSMVSTVNWSVTQPNFAGGNTSSRGRFFKYVGAEGAMMAGTIDYIPGRSEIVAPAMDNVYFSGTSGVTWLNRVTGERSRDVRILGDYTNVGFENTNFTKSNNWGGVTVLCNPAPIQIGNRVWRDDNQNGIQDPCEPPIAGAVVRLYNATKTTIIASATTNAAGEYYFSNTASTTVTSTSAVVTTALQANTTYGLVLASLGSSTVVTSQGLALTDVSPLTPGESGTLNTGTTTINNDAKLDVVSGTSLPCIKLTTGDPGSTNHTYDFGMVKIPCTLTVTAQASPSNTICVGQPVRLVANVTPEGSYTYSWAAPAGVALTGATTATATATALPVGVNTFTVTVTSAPNCRSTVTVSVTVNPLPAPTVASTTICAGSSAVLTVQNCAGTVRWSNNATTQSITVAPQTTTQYSVSCTVNGCVGTTTATVTVLPPPLLNLTASATLVTAGTNVNLTASGCVGTVTWSNGATGSPITVTPTQATQTYSATCTTGPGCFTTASIVIKTAPPANLVVTSATVCFGSSATLTASGCIGTVTWSNGTTGNTLVTPTLTQTTSYTATCTAATSTTTATGTVTVLPRPVLNLTASSTLVTAGTNVTLTAAGCAGTVRWSNGQTTTSIVVTPTQTTQTYSATCTTGPACFTTASIVINTAPRASISVTSATVCFGNSATLTASGCTGTTTWSNGTMGNTLVTPTLTQTTSYTATCTATTSSTFAVGNVTVLSQPVLSLSASSTLVTVGTNVVLTASGCVGTVRWNTGQTGTSIMVMPTQTTQTYSATCTTGPNCFTTASIVINTEPPANLVVISATVCYGSSGTLTAAGCVGTVTWSNGTTGNTLVTPTLTQTSSYTATCTTATSTSSAVGTVTVLPQPVLSLSASSTLVTAGNSVTLTATVCVGTVTWSNGSTGSSIVVQPTQSSQTYVATCTTGPNCFTTASIVVNTVPPCSVSLTVTPGACLSATNTFSATATLTVNNLLQPQSVTITLGGTSQVYTLSALTTNTIRMTVDNLASNGASLTAIARLSAADCALATAVFNAPTSCEGSPNLVLTKLVSTTVAQIGDVISYTITLTNTGPVPATSVVVNDSASAGVTIIPGTITTSAGTFTPNLTGGTWSVSTLPAGATATLIYSVSVSIEGVVYNTASVPNTDVRVCTTIPYKVCKGEPYAILLQAPAGFNRYQWYLTAPGATTATLVSDGTLNSFTATLPGAYQVVIDEGLNSACPPTGCCPILIEEVEVPLFTVLTQNPTCVGSEPQANGQLSISGLSDTRRYTYQYSVGSSFDAASAVPVPATSIPTNGVIATGLATNNYTVRLTDRQTGCFRDVTVALVSNCVCPEDVCVPVSIRKITSR
ncbi:SdrD B-like domain-containing protein [Rudanella lutea]|uniref:SdrD B-like domain-containing protein n=1 Tax=Rudanella lutea TaxID=451374 RepID=UPI00037372CB|nr:SdrD B-like domain-containing protein [Rudanella lutea]